LQERTGKFRKQTNAIAEWDRRILNNRDVLLRLQVSTCKQLLINFLIIFYMPTG